MIVPAELRIRPRRTWEVVAAARGAIRGGGEDVLRAVMGQAPGARLAPDGVWRVLRPDDGEPWFTAGLRGREIVLGVSFTQPRFLRNFADLHQQAARIGRALEAEVLSDDLDVAGEDLAKLLAPGGPYVERFAAVHREVFAAVQENGWVPMEFALGGQVDQTSVAFAVRVTGAPGASLAWGQDSGLRLQNQTPTAGALWDGELPLLRVGVGPDGAFQVWSAYGRAPFARWARAAVALGDAIARARGGSVELAGLGPLDPVREEVDPRLDGLGCDWVGWMLGRSRAG